MVDVAVDNNLSTPFCGQTSQHFDMQAYPVSLTHATMEVVLKPTIRTNMHICVPVLILCPILGLIWVLSSYICSAMGVIFVYNRTNMYICVPVMILCPIIGLIWVLSWDIPTPWVLSSYIPCARVGIYKENTRGVGISQEKKLYQSEYETTDG